MRICKFTICPICHKSIDGMNGAVQYLDQFYLLHFFLCFRPKIGTDHTDDNNGSANKVVGL